MDIKNVLKYNERQFNEWYEKSFKAAKTLNEMYKNLSEIPKKNPFVNYDNLPETCASFEDILKQNIVLNPDFSSYTSVKREIEYTEEALKCLENIKRFYFQENKIDEKEKIIV